MVFHIDDYDVHFSYDPGDRSTGDPGGWEETLITAKLPEGRELVIGFVPSDSLPVAEWPIDYLSVDAVSNGGRQSMVIADDTTAYRLDALGLYRQVERAWEMLNWHEYLNNLGEDCWMIDSHIDELRWDFEHNNRAVNADEMATLRDELSDAKHWYQWAQEVYSARFSDIEAD